MSEIEDKEFDEAFEEFADNDVEVGEIDDVVEEVAEEVEAPVDDAEKYRLEAEQWQHRYNSDIGRQNALQRKIQQLEEDNLKLQKAKPADMTNKEWSELQADYPEIATAIESKFAEKEQQRNVEVEQLRGQVEQMRQRDEQSYRDAQYRILEQQHPDWKAVAGSQEFGAWIKQQPNGVQTLIDSEDAADAAYLLNLYRPKAEAAVNDNSNIRERRERQLKQAQTVPSRGGRARSNLPAEDDYEASFNYFAAKQKR